MVDVEAILTAFLRAQTAVAALAADRVYTDLPNARTYPLVVLSRTGGGFVVNRPQWLEAAQVTLDAYGGNRKTAADLVNACIDAIAASRGSYPQGCITTARTDSIAYNPDSESPDEDGHARPRFTANFTVFIHP